MPHDNTLATDVRELLTALRDMLDVPRPRDRADESVFRDLSRDRMIQAKAVLDGLLDTDTTSTVDLESCAYTIRSLTDHAPVTYETRS